MDLVAPMTTRFFLSTTPFCWGVGYGHLSSDPMLGTEVYELSGEILSSIIRPQDLDLLSKLVLHKSSELLEPIEDLTLGLQEIDPGLP
jgi:hypothetical protein